MKALSDLSDHLAEVDYSDGYSHDDLDAILAGVGLGVVPVLWEDNLPQVAIEMHARHIPLLTSDRGGARELGNSPEFVFPAGDVDAFCERIAEILDGRVDVAAYWRNARSPVSIPNHIQELLAIYRSA
jgi:glycosyltransferase involved in cell wall biosynthesis